MKNIQRLELPAAADMHVHLRQGELMDLVVPTVQQGGVDTVFVYEFSVLEQIEYTEANKMQ
jgi:dihydroorotase